MFSWSYPLVLGLSAALGPWAAEAPPQSPGPDAELLLRWRALADDLNDWAGEAANAHWFLFDFGERSLSTLQGSEAAFVRRVCGPVADLEAAAATTELDGPAFARFALSGILGDVDAALANAPLPDATRDGLLMELESVLLELAGSAEQIVTFRVQKDCQGYFNHRHWVLSWRDGQSVSVSLGGGE